MRGILCQPAVDGRLANAKPGTRRGHILAVSQAPRDNLAALSGGHLRHGSFPLNFSYLSQRFCCDTSEKKWPCFLLLSWRSRASHSLTRAVYQHPKSLASIFMIYFANFY